MKKVLIVDDAKMPREGIERIIIAEEFFATSVESPEEALEILSKGDLPDIITTDLNMPGMDGIEFYLELQKNETTKNIPVIFLTTDPETAVARLNDAKLEAAGVIYKPNAVTLLPSVLQKIVHGKPKEAPIKKIKSPVF